MPTTLPPYSRRKNMTQDGTAPTVHIHLPQVSIHVNGFPQNNSRGGFLGSTIHRKRRRARKAPPPFHTLPPREASRRRAFAAGKEERSVLPRSALPGFERKFAPAWRLRSSLFHSGGRPSSEPWPRARSGAMKSVQ